MKNPESLRATALALALVAASASAQDVPTLFAVEGGPDAVTAHAVAGLGDVDGDQVNDLVVGLPGTGEAGSTSASRAWVLSGATGVMLHQLDGGMLFPSLGKKEGEGPIDVSFGWSVAGVGDTNGDGVPDLIVGALGNPSSEIPGRVGVFSGADGRLSLLLAGDAGFASYGWAVAGLGDVDHDGRADLLVGEPDGGLGGGGRAYVYSGADGGLLHQLAPFDLTPGAGFGRTVVGLGDVNEDGTPDFAVGAPAWGQGPGTAAQPGPGRVYVYSGVDAKRLAILTGSGPGWLFGQALASGTDVDDDGLDDLLVGAPGVAFGRGRVLVYTWRQGAAAFGGLELTVTVDSREELGFGAAVSAAGDLDDDGHGDFLVGAPIDGGLAADGGPGTSHVRAFSGLTGDELMRVDAPAGGWQLGASLGFVGDVFGKGSDAFILGAPGYADAAGQAIVGVVPGKSSQSALPEPANVLDGRPGQPVLVEVPTTEGGGFQDLAFGSVVITPQADGDSVAADLFVAEGVKFVATANATVGEGPQDTVKADFNKDGRSDFATANKGANSFSTVVTPAASFSGSELGVVTSFPTGANTSPRAIAAGDLDGDDFPDVVVSGDLGISVFLNDTVGGFFLTDLHTMPVVTDLDLGDFDGDDVLDVLATSGAQGGGGIARIFLGDGDGTLTSNGTFAAGPALVSAVTGDLDEDGDLDALVVAHFMAGGVPGARIAAFLNDGAGAMAAAAWPAFQVSSADGIVPTFGAVSDIDRDGLADAVFTSNDNAVMPDELLSSQEPPLELTILVNRGSDPGGTWLGFDASVLGTAYAGRAMEPILADIFTDPDQPLASDPDLILVWFMDELAGQSPVPQPTAFLGLLVGDGQGSFFDPDPNQFVMGDQPGDGDQGDVGGGTGDPGAGGDGVPDLVFPNLLSNSVKVLLGDGTGGIAGVVETTGIDELDRDALPPGLWSGGPRCVRLLHLDGDGLLDVVVANEWRDEFLGDVRASLSLLVATGGGALVKTQYIVLPRAGELAVADVDLDGLSDVVMSQRIGPGPDDSLLVYRGQGDGTVDDEPQVVEIPGRLLTGGLAAGPAGALAGPILVSTSRDPVTGRGVLLAWPMRAGHGLGDAIASDCKTKWQIVEGLVLADVDGDGLGDACVGTAAGRLILARGLGAGSFTEQALNPAAAAVGGGALAVDRLNGDGWVDIVSSKGSGAAQSGVHVLAGTPGGNFTASMLAGLSASGDLGAQRPLLLDFDDDGALDVVLSHGTGNAISVLLSALNVVDPIDPGKPGSGGITPKLRVKGYTTPGSGLLIELDSGMGGAGAWLFAAMAGAPGQVPALSNVWGVLPLKFGGDPGVPGAGGGIALKVRLPSEPAIVGFSFALQALVADAGAPPTPAPAGVAASNALLVTIVE